MSKKTGRRAWDVLLLGGPSGTGKTAVSYPLAQAYGVGITEVDDFQVLLEAVTTPEQQPAIHFWRTHPDPHSLTAEEMLQNLIAIGEAMAPGLEAVIANHLESDAPVVLEGDFIMPSLAARPQFGGVYGEGRVRAVFLYEDEEQLVRNFLEREPHYGPQAKRTRVSWLHGQWLKREAERYGVPALPARPWETLFERIVAAAAEDDGS